MKRVLVAVIGLAILGGALWFLSGRETAVRGLDPLAPRAPQASSGAVTPLAAEPSAPAATRGPERAEVAPDVPDAPAQAVASAPAPATGTLRVLARWDHGGAATGVVVIARSNSGRTSYPVERTLRTDESGLAVFEAFPSGPVWVRLLRGEARAARVGPGGETTVELAIPAGLTVSGQVRDETGSAVPEASLWLSIAQDALLGELVARADRAGRYRIESIPPDAHYLGARADGFAPSAIHKLQGTVGEHVELDLVLRAAGAHVTGIVRDQDGEPLAEARVLIGPERPPMEERSSDGSWLHGAPALRLTTDEQGRFETRSAPLGLQPVMARAQEFGTLREEHDLVAGIENRLELFLQPETIVAGTVRNEDGDRVGWARVEVPGTGRFESVSTHSSGRGDFELRGLSAGRHHVVVKHDDHGADETFLDVRAGERVEWDPVLREGPRIFGTLYGLDDEPWPNHGITIRGGARSTPSYQTRVTDGLGEFTFNDVDPSATYTVIVPNAAGYAHFAFLEQEVVPSTTPLELRVSGIADRTGGLIATLTGPDGEVVPGALLSVNHVESREWRSFPFDSRTGRLELDTLPPGTLRLEVRSDDYPWLQVGEVELEAGATTDLGQLTLQRPLRLAGSLTGGNDEQLESLEFSLTGPSGREVGIVTRDGRQFRSSPLVAGAYTLTVKGTGIRLQRVAAPVEAGSENRVQVELQVVPTRVLHARSTPGTAVSPWTFVRLYHPQTNALEWYGRAEPLAPDLLECVLSAPAGTWRFEGSTMESVRFSGEVEILEAADAPPVEVSFQGD